MGVGPLPVHGDCLGNIILPLQLTLISALCTFQNKSCGFPTSVILGTVFPDVPSVWFDFDSFAVYVAYALQLEYHCVS
jgi:hypothetical protein